MTESVSTMAPSPRTEIEERPVSPSKFQLRRILSAVARRWRLAGARAGHPVARFGPGCDVRCGLNLTVWGKQSRVHFGPACVLDRYMTVECSESGEILVGARTIFGHHCTLAAAESLSIGEDCLIAEMVSIRDHDHCFDELDVPVREQGAVCAPVRIGSNVWLGAKVTVTRGVTIGDNAIVGANSVVTRDIPANAIAVGAPARVIRLRERSETI